MGRRFCFSVFFLFFAACSKHSAGVKASGFASAKATVAPKTTSETATGERLSALTPTDRSLISVDLTATSTTEDLAASQESLVEATYGPVSTINIPTLAAILQCKARTGGTHEYDPINGCIQIFSAVDVQNCNAGIWQDNLGCVPPITTLEQACANATNPSLYWVNNTCSRPSQLTTPSQCPPPNAAGQLTSLQWYQGVCYDNPAIVDCFKGANGISPGYWFSDGKGGGKCLQVDDLSQAQCALYNGLTWDNKCSQNTTVSPQLANVTTVSPPKISGIQGLGSFGCLAGETQYDPAEYKNMYGGKKGCYASKLSRMEYRYQITSGIYPGPDVPSIFPTTDTIVAVGTKNTFNERFVPNPWNNDATDTIVSVSNSISPPYPTVFSMNVLPAESCTAGFSIYSVQLSVTDTSSAMVKVDIMDPYYKRVITVACNNEGKKPPAVSYGPSSYFAEMLASRCDGRSYTAYHWLSTDPNGPSWGCSPYPYTIWQCPKEFPYIAGVTNYGLICANQKEIPLVDGSKAMPFCYSQATGRDLSDNSCIYTSTQAQASLQSNYSANVSISSSIAGIAASSASVSFSCSKGGIGSLSFVVDATNNVSGLSVICQYGNESSVAYGASGTGTMLPFNNNGSPFSSLQVFNDGAQIVGYIFTYEDGTTKYVGASPLTGAATLASDTLTCPKGENSVATIPIGITVKQTNASLTQMGLICGAWSVAPIPLSE
jgi:hypothetical protein